jgi:glycosyltransferase involved in cell wall biosynthesis
MVTFEGELYHWSKHYEFLKFIDLPASTGQRFELALASFDDADRLLLEEHGWGVRDAAAFGHDTDAYRDFIHGARAEFSVAKDQNIRLRSGWFSERSACFLASGLPVVVQDTAFDCVLPTGEGLFSFRTADEAADAIEQVSADPARHGRRALEIAREYFSHEVVLGRLLSDLGMPARVRRARRRRTAPTGVAYRLLDEQP